MTIWQQTPMFIESRALATLEAQQVNAMVGGKCAALVELRRWELPVPEFSAITTRGLVATLEANNMDAVVDWLQRPSATEVLDLTAVQRALANAKLPPALDAELSCFMERHPQQKFAVRSSGTLEDGITSSFAGMYKTILNVSDLPSLRRAIRDCWAAFFDERALHYLRDLKINQEIGLSLVIQHMVDADKSGVLFTLDPLKGQDSELLIEACFGLGEALVSGHVTPDQYRYDWRRESVVNTTVATKTCHCIRTENYPFTKLEPLAPERQREPVLLMAEILSLAELAVEVQSHYGFPVDIEWAFDGAELFILQSRPITKINFTAVQGEWTTADLRDGGVSSSVCTPLMASLYKMVMDHTMASYLEGLGLPKRAGGDVWLTTFFSRPYWNLEAVKYYLSKIPGFNERAFDTGLGIEPKYQGDGLQAKSNIKTLAYGLRALVAIKLNARRQLAMVESFAARQEARLKELAAYNFGEFTDEKLFQFADQFFTREYFDNEATYFNFVYDNSNINALFQEKLEKIGCNPNEFPHLLAGLDGVSHLAFMKGLWQLRALIIDQGDETYWLSNPDIVIHDLNTGKDKPSLREFSQFLQKFGHHSKRELDITVPRYSEEPEYVVKLLQDVLKQEPQHDPGTRNQQQRLQAEKAKTELLNKVPKWQRKSMAKKLEQIRTFLWWREELRDYSTRYYAVVRRLAIEVARRLVQLNLLQKTEDIFFLSLSQLQQGMQKKITSNQLQVLVKQNKAYYDGFRNFTIPDEIGQRYSLNDSIVVNCEGNIKGVAGSAGCVTATARVIVDIHDVGRIKEGDILITRCTDPGWTAVFSKLQGVVTETGGMLSHAAVICREYGIPAVLAVKNATKIIQDGDLITIDGNNGALLIVEQTNHTAAIVELEVEE